MRPAQVLQTTLCQSLNPVPLVIIRPAGQYKYSFKGPFHLMTFHLSTYKSQARRLTWSNYAIKYYHNFRLLKNK